VQDEQMEFYKVLNRKT